MEQRHRFDQMHTLKIVGHRHHPLIESTLPSLAATKGREKRDVNVNVRQRLNDGTALVLETIQWLVWTGTEKDAPLL